MSIRKISKDMVDQTFFDEIGANTDDKIGNFRNDVTSQLAHKAEESALNVERQRINGLISFPPSIDNAETADIRVGWDGITYASAGDAVRATIGSYMTEENESWVI